LREIINAIFYVMVWLGGYSVDLPPWSTVYRWFAAWRDAWSSRGSITLLSWQTAQALDAKAPRFQ